MEWYLFIGPLLLDFATYVLIIAVPVSLLVQRIRRQSTWARRLYSALLLLSSSFGFLLGFLVVLVARLEIWPNGSLYAHEWRAIEFHLGLPDYGQHWETPCV